MGLIITEDTGIQRASTEEPIIRLTKPLCLRAQKIGP